MASPLRPPLAKSKRRRREPLIPKDLRRVARQYARALAKKYRPLFAADPKLKDRVLRLVSVLLPPRPRRPGHPGNPDVNRAIRLLRRFRREHPEESSQQHWARVDEAIIRNFHSMTAIDREATQFALRQRVDWRLQKRRRKIRRKISGS